MADRMQCGFCLGEAVLNGERRWVHRDSAQRASRNGNGDMVSSRHNQAGTVVLAVDLVEWENEAE